MPAFDSSSIRSISQRIASLKHQSLVFFGITSIHTFIMLHNSVRLLPVLALSLLASAGPLETREPVPGIIDDILTGILSGVGQLIKDVLSGAKSAIDDTKSNKPITCSIFTTDKCCVCKSTS